MLYIKIKKKLIIILNSLLGDRVRHIYSTYVLFLKFPF